MSRSVRRPEHAMMVKALAAAKINLYLNVIRRRPDGYHDIETVYQPVSLYDEITVELAGGEISVSGNDPSVPWNEENLCHRASRLVLERFRMRRGVRIKCVKGIPTGAGLGGGSADAAATLVALDRLLGLGLTFRELAELGAELGSDVPFFLFGRAAIGRGRGDILEPVPGLCGGWILIVKPNVSISTKWAYRNLNLLLTKAIGKDKLTLLVNDLQRFPAAMSATYNSFEAGVAERFPVVAEILSRMREARPMLSALSGSGSACFAIFEGESEAREVAKRFDREGLFARIVRPVREAIRVE